MPSLNLDLDYFTNPKVTRLVGLLGVEGFIIPIRLWCYVGKHHPTTGLLTGYSKEEIEQVVEWPGETGRCVDALVKIKFLIEKKESFAVNDWLEHAGHLAAYKKRAKLAAKARWTPHATSIASSNAKPVFTNAPTSHLIASQSDPKQTETKQMSEGSVRGVGELSVPAPQKAAELTDAEWLQDLKSSIAYRSLDIDRQFENCRLSCEKYQKPFTRKRFLAWLNHRS